MTRDFFDRQMARMGGLRFVPADMETHWEGLSELPEDVLKAAVGRAVKVRIEFPVPQELREDADAVAHLVRGQPAEVETELETPIDVPIPHTNRTIKVTREYRIHCEECQDTGWTARWCGDVGSTPPHPWVTTIRTCAQRRPHDAHEYVVPCPCGEMNPALARKREAQRQYAERTGRKA